MPQFFSIWHFLALLITLTSLFTNSAHLKIFKKQKCFKYQFNLDLPSVSSISKTISSENWQFHWNKNKRLFRQKLVALHIIEKRHCITSKQFRKIKNSITQPDIQKWRKRKSKCHPEILKDYFFSVQLLIQFSLVSNCSEQFNW